MRNSAALSENLTEEDPGNKCVGIETVLVFLGDITQSKKIEFFAISTASDVNREQDGPSDQAADKAYDRCDFEISKEEIGVQRLVV